MNKLTLTSKGYTYEIDGNTAPEPHFQTDFVIDGISLSSLFEFEDDRPWFGQTCFDMKGEYREGLILQLKGISESKNQFDSDRFVLYGCHCGSDYCGVISCRIDREDEVVRWSDIRFESEAGTEEEALYGGVVAEYVFDREQYDFEIERFM